MKRVKQDTVGEANPVSQRLHKRNRGEGLVGGIREREGIEDGVSRWNTARQLQKLPVKRRS